MNLLDYVWPTYTVAFLAVLVCVWAVRLPLTGYPNDTYAMFLLLGLIPTVIGHSSLNWALRYLSANFVAISVLGEPVGAALLALLILQEAPSPLKILFGLVILFGIYVAARGEIRR
jgi:drug/metabolite transporter (DMT)-like permease